MEFVDKAKDALFKEHIFNNTSYAQYHPDKINFNANITPTLEPIFDALEIKNRCCRMHLMTKTDFDRIY